MKFNIYEYLVSLQVLHYPINNLNGSINLQQDSYILKSISSYGKILFHIFLSYLFLFVVLPIIELCVQ